MRSPSRDRPRVTSSSAPTCNRFSRESNHENARSFLISISRTSSRRSGPSGQAASRYEAHSAGTRALAASNSSAIRSNRDCAISRYLLWVVQWLQFLGKPPLNGIPRALPRPTKMRGTRPAPQWPSEEAAIPDLLYAGIPFLEARQHFVDGQEFLGSLFGDKRVAAAVDPGRGNRRLGFTCRSRLHILSHFGTARQDHQFVNGQFLFLAMGCDVEALFQQPLLHQAELLPSGASRQFRHDRESITRHPGWCGKLVRSDVIRLQQEIIERVGASPSSWIGRSRTTKHPKAVRRRFQRRRLECRPRVQGLREAEACNHH